MGRKKKEKSAKRPIKVLTLDTETRGLFGGIFRIGLYDGKKYFVASDMNSIRNIITKYINKYDCHIFIHNLDFDLAKMAKDLIPGADLNKSIFINNNVTVFTTNFTTMSTTEENEIISYPVTFHDSNKIILGRLKNICKDFGLDEHQSKIDLKDHILAIGWGRDREGKPTSDPDLYDDFESEGYYFENVDPFEKQLNDYLRQDCISLHHVVNTLIEISGLNIYDFMKCPTTASLAMKVYEMNYPDEYSKAVSTQFHGADGKYNEKFIRESYCGGRTEVFTPYIEYGYHRDVNSLYPYVMKKHMIPYGKPTMYKGDKAKQMYEYWYAFNQGAGFLQVDIFIPDNLFIPPLPVKRMNKLIFPVGNVRGIWTFEEIKKALEMGCKIIKYYQCLFFDKKAFLFKDFISYFEEIKNNSEGAKRVFSKLVQNSLYGKFGMQRIRKTIVPITELEKCEKRYQEENLKFVVLSNPLIPGEQFIECEIESKAPYIQPHIAAYITSMARLELYEGLLRQQAKGVVSYCDTDSIVSEHDMDEQFCDKKEYGKWSLDSEVLHGIFLQPKTYYEKHPDGDETKKFKGIPGRKMQGITEETYNTIFSKLKEIQRKKENGEFISKDESYFPLYTSPEKKRQKFATLLKNGRSDFDEHIEITKGILLTNEQKREMDYIGNTSKPHKLKDFIYNPSI